MSDKNVPEGFFKDLPDRIINRIIKEEQQQELSSHSKLLTSMIKENPYCVPQDYFKTLSIKNTSPKKTRRLWPVITTVAACIGLLFMVISGTTDNSIEVSDTDILDYYVENSQDLNTELLSELVMSDEESFVDEELEEIINSLSDYELELINQTL